jgi:hypothetical protein
LRIEKEALAGFSILSGKIRPAFQGCPDDSFLTGGDEGGARPFFWHFLAFEWVIMLKNALKFGNQSWCFSA